MTVNVARRRSKDRLTMAESTMAIGEIGQTIFGCPACSRPLAVGVRRCPGCSTHLLMGVQAGRASMFVTVGLILGVAFGGGMAAVLSAIRLPAHDAQVADAATAAALARAVQVQPVAPAPAIASPAAGGSTGTGASLAIPAISASALGQALVLDNRLADSAGALQAALTATTFDAFEVSQILRDASADSVIGIQLTQNLKSWSGGTVIGDQLSTFYATVQSTAAEGLGASIRNEAAYRRAAAAMVELLAGLKPIDGQARDLATSSGISLPVDAPPAP